LEWGTFGIIRVSFHCCQEFNTKINIYADIYTEDYGAVKMLRGVVVRKLILQCSTSDDSHN